MQTSESQGPQPRAKCCICKKSITFEIDANALAINSEGFDPCALVIVTNAFGPREAQREQEFPCHIECFRRIIDDDSLMYILEPDFESVGELGREQEREAAELAELAVKISGTPAV